MNKLKSNILYILRRRTSKCRFSNPSSFRWFQDLQARCYWYNSPPSTTTLNCLITKWFFQVFIQEFNDCLVYVKKGNGGENVPLASVWQYINNLVPCIIWRLCIIEPENPIRTMTMFSTCPFPQVPRRVDLPWPHQHHKQAQFKRGECCSRLLINNMLWMQWMSSDYLVSAG
jgi:hypothetical protein